MKQKKLWVINYLDEAGYRGIVVDIETLKNFNAHIYTTFTVLSKYSESNHSVLELKVQPLIPQLIKVGWISNQKVFKQIKTLLSNYSGKLILDGLFFSHSDRVMRFDNFIDNFIKLFSYTYLFICNVKELEKVVNITLNTYQDIREAAHCLIKWGVKNVLIKGGQLKKGVFCQDYWCNQEESFWIVTPRLFEKNVDTKDIFSSAMIACLVRDYSLKDALIIARMYVQRGLRKTYIENQTVKFFHNRWPDEQIDLPYLSKEPLLKFPNRFKVYQTGFYPIVESSQWVEKLLAVNVKTIQLRIKNKSTLVIAEEIQRSVLLAKKYQATLFVNDYWKLAIQYGACGVHLGQEDLDTADIDEIYQSGLYLGLSTHCYYEVAYSHTFNPSYMACGPIYPTQSKTMSFQAQGTVQLNYWRRMLDYPIVAIGGITLERLNDVLESGIDGVAVISAITQANNPCAMSQKFLLQMQRKDAV